MSILDGHFPGSVIQQGSVKIVPGEHISHWELSGAVYHVAIHLADSVPADQLRIWREKRLEFSERRKSRPGQALTDEEVAELRELYNEKIERYLNAGYGCCALRSSAVAEAIAKALEHGHNRTHRLRLLTIMPNHLHIIAMSLGEFKMAEIVNGWKSVSAHAIAKISGMKAPIWLRDHYSRIIRTPEEYQKQDSYIWHNPETAGLSEGYFRKRY